MNDKTASPVSQSPDLNPSQVGPADAVRLHAYYQGKMSTLPKVPIRDLSDFSIWYTPGVAAVCQAIAAAPERVFDLTSKGNTVAIISDGTRVLGLGDIGPEAGLPVMEGKALLFKYLGGVDAVPLMLDAMNPNEFIETVLRLQAGFGGINLEDIAQPKCFQILAALNQRTRIPVWHDDQQGTATVTLAGLMNALKVVGKEKQSVRLAMIGAGAAGVACARLLFKWGINPAQTVIVDAQGALHPGRIDFPDETPQAALCKITNKAGIRGGIAEALVDADAVIAYAQPGPGVILPEWIATMARDPIVFACANPIPEIWPAEARAAGAAVVATGRSDFPNQVNNALSFPAIFRGVLDVRARAITDEMCFAAAEALAGCAEDYLDAEHILPTLMDAEIYPLQAAAVGIRAQDQGLAQRALTYDELLDSAEHQIGAAQAALDVLMTEQCVPPLPER